MKKVFTLLFIVVFALGCRKDKLSKHVFWMNTEKAAELSEKGIEHVMIVWDTKNGQTSHRLNADEGFDEAPDCDESSVAFEINLRKYSGKYNFEIRSVLDTAIVVLNLQEEGCFQHDISDSIP